MTTTELRIEIPGVPPSGNHYKTYRVVGKHVQWYHTAKAKAWWGTVAAFARGRHIESNCYNVSWVVYFPNARLTDVDNLEKTLFDGLARAGVITNDRHIRDHHGYTRIDRANPRTVIVIRTDQESLC